MENHSFPITASAELVRAPRAPLCPPKDAGPVDPSAIRNHLWRQGSVCAPEFVEWLRRKSFARQSSLETSGADDKEVHPAVAILLSQDCDIVQSRYEVEPFVEVILCEPISRVEGLYINGRNPRRLDIEIEHNGGSGAAYAVLASERYFVPRWALEHCKPDPSRSVDPVDLGVIVSFIVNRYIRAALPDEFNRRRHKSRGRINKLLERAEGDFASVFIELKSTEELPPGNDYEVEVYFVLSEDQYADATKKERATRTHLPDFRNALNSCDGIKVSKGMVVTEWGVNVADKRRWFQWPIQD